MLAARAVAGLVAWQVVAQVQATAVKNIEVVADYFLVRLSEAVTGFFNGERTIADVAATMRQLLRSYAMDVYQEGMKEGGIDNPEAELDDEDEATVTAWINEQMSFVPGFIDDLKLVTKAKDRGAAQEAINARVELWRGSLGNLGSLGKASAQRNKMVTWEYGDTQHCSTCAGLNGKRHRLKWFLTNDYIPQQNGSETLECGGWYCQCRLMSDDGEQVMP